MDKEIKLAALLEDVAAGRRTAEAAVAEIDTWEDADWNRDYLLRESYHLLQHLAADGNIRERDASYAQSQFKILEQLAASLRRGE